MHAVLALVLALGVLFGAGCLAFTWWRRRARQVDAAVEQRAADMSRPREGLDRTQEELIALRAALQRSHTQLHAAFNQFRHGVIIVDQRHDLLFANDAARRLLARSDGRVEGRPLREMLPVAPDALAAIQSLLRDPHPHERYTTRLDTSSGQRHWLELETALDPRDPRNAILYLYDVTETHELKRAQLDESSAQIARALTPLVGSSLPMQMVQAQIRAVAATPAMVLIEGERGTGKKVVARAIHEVSGRRHRPFASIGCGGMTEARLASQLFGHRRGACPGAANDHAGLFESTQGGTLLLDEIADMPMSVQASLLRVLQEGEVVRVGDSRGRRVDVRVLAATHRNLEEAVRKGTFREELFQRIAIVRIVIPPLRARRDDVLPLATAFLDHFGAMYGRALEGFDREAMEQLKSRAWPGNVRELRGVVEQVVMRAAGPMIRVSDLGVEAPAEPLGNLSADSTAAPLISSSNQVSDDKRRRIQEALTEAGGNRSVAARLLGMSRSTFYRHLAALEEEAASEPDPRFSGPSAPSS